MANRRNFLIKLKQNRTSTITGWGFSANDENTSIALTNSSGKILSSSDMFIERQDVINAYQKDGVVVPLKSGFSLSYPGYKSDITNGFLELRTSTSVSKIKIDSLLKKKIQTLEVNDNDKNIIVTVENKKFQKLSNPENIIDKIRHTVWIYYGKIVLFLSILTIPLLLVYVIKKRQEKIDSLSMIIFFISFVILTRMLLFALLDISSWSGVQPRYLFPIMPLYTVIVMLLLNKTLILFKRTGD